jgi:hypothetical protein
MITTYFDKNLVQSSLNGQAVDIKLKELYQSLLPNQSKISGYLEDLAKRTWPSPNLCVDFGRQRMQSEDILSKIPENKTPPST